jgi:hypothetical protein
MVIKNLKKCFMAVIFLISSLGCASAYYSCRMATISESEKLPRKSFALVLNSVKIRACIGKKNDQEKNCQTGVVSASSSGIFVARSEIDKGVNYVLTAGHSCSSGTFKDRFDSPGVTLAILGHDITVSTYYGIFAGYHGIENVAITSPHAALKIFVKNNIALGEMALFAKKKVQQQLIIERLK